MTYIHERQSWPELTYDMEALVTSLTEVRHRQGKLLGKMEALGFELRAEASLVALTNEIVKSSAIEGEILDSEEVRSSVARRMGLDIGGLPKTERNVEGVVELMLDATRNFETPLTSERLLDWHAALFPTGRSGMQWIDVGQWREDKDGPMQVVSGAMGREHIHFQAPDASRIYSEMRTFMHWFNHCQEMDPVIKAGISHLWFITIHPFDDGNGRIARAITDMALARADGSPERFYSMSAQIESERKEYYIQLETAQRGSLDITSWLAWFVDCLGRSINTAEIMLASVLYKANLWHRINQNPVNERQSRVINRMLERDWKGHMNTSKYAKLAACSHDTALRDINILLERGIFIKNEGGGRSTSYRLVK